MMSINKRILLRTTLALIFLLVFVSKKPAWALKNIPYTEYLALEAFYNATGGDSWYDDTNWLDTLSTSEWYGVSFSGGHIRGINLQINQTTGNYLRGFIPPEIGNLTELQVLNLANNYLEGPIPESIKNLTKLTTLNLSFNNLTWSDPTLLGNMPLLIQLYLNGNSLGDKIPSEIYGLGFLEELGLISCGLSGDISFNIDSLANLDSLKSLELGQNKFTGSIPTGIDVFSNLNVLHLGSNLLTGEIPNSIGDLSNLTSLYLNDNQLSGTIPMGIWQLKKLVYLNLGQNYQLKGTIPPDIKNLTKLIRLYLNHNQLTGTIPTEIGDLKELQQISLQNNQFSGSIPDSIGTLPVLNGLNLSNNQLSGNIPSGIGNLQGLQTLDLSYNQLLGTIPTEVEKLTNLQILKLGDNQLTGKIPRGVSDFKQLSTLNVRNNYFDVLPPLSNIIYQLTCDSNLFTFEDFEKNLDAIENLGSNFKYTPQRPFGREHDTTAINDRPFTLKIPCGGINNHYTWYKNGSVFPSTGDVSELSFSKIQFSDTGYYHVTVVNDTVHDLTLTSLRVRLLVESACIEPDSMALVAFYNATGGPNWKKSLNWKTGPINTWFGISTDSCSVTKIELPDNNLTGPFPPALYNLSNLDTLNLSGNNLGGNISTAIGQLSNLQFLSLSNDSLSGTIPIEITTLLNLSQLSLSDNQLTGNIPPAIGSLILLKGLNFANNQLSGIIPTSIGGLDYLEYLALNNNKLTGNIPLEIGNLTQLEVLRIDENIITGSIPANINNLSNLHYFQFQNNLISDISSLSTIDSLIYCQNNYLTFEDFELNLDVIREKTVDFQYSPQYKFGMEDTITIVEDNTFNLSIPCGGKYNHYTWFKDNDTIKPTPPDNSTLLFKPLKLTDAGTYHITVKNDSVPGLTLYSEPIHLIVKEHCIKNDSLVLVALFAATGGNNWTNNENWLTRPVNSWYGIEADSCSVFKIDLTHNNLTGSISIPKEIIPPGFEYFKQLNHLFLDSNQITGEIPPAIGGFSELKELDLSFNNFLNGPIPDTLYSLKNLTWLGLHNNGLSGVISSKIGNLKKLEYLNLSDNKLERNIPVEIGSLSNLIYLNFERNKLNDNIPKEIGNLPNLRHLILSHNLLYGSLPDEFGLLTSLTNLQVNNNQLSGNVPLGISNLKFIDKIRLENNNFNDIPDLSILNTLLYCANNYLTFEDFERNLLLIGKKKTFDFQYIPQKNFGSPYDTIAYEGAPFKFSIPAKGVYNHYKWFHNIIPENPSPDSEQFTFKSIELTDSGYYRITVTNDSVPDLELISNWVHIYIFKKPVLPSYNCDLINNPLSDTLTWNKVAWADSYGFQLSTSSSFNTILIDTSEITATSYTISNLEHGTKYYWRVNASDSIGTSGWSEVCNFETLPEIPDPPTLESICNGPEIEELSLSVSWYDPSYRAESYSLQVSISPDFSDTLISVSGIKSTSYTITTGLDFNTTYYWRVNARNINGASEWSEVCSFKTYQPELSFNNLVIIDGQHTPFFWIEGIKYNPDNNLVVFSKWGKKVYSKSGYNNELDFSAFPAGTYYYVLNVKINNVQKQYKSFVDVVKQ